jgi:oligopeptide/dipeptide ABC transporter ATP-binding protein
MYLGQIVETADKATLFARPRHPYTRALLAAAPEPDPSRRAQKTALGGDVPSPMNPPPGCRFHTRCPFVQDRCRVEMPVLRDLEPAHGVACHFAESIAAQVSAPPARTVHPRLQKRLDLYAQHRAAAQEAAI